MRAISITLLSLLALTACSGGDHQDLRQWMNEASKDIKGKIPPLPQVKPYEPAAYAVGNQIDPFKVEKLGVEQKKQGGGLRPDMDRPREPLEAYPLDSLNYVGIMSKKKATFALIRVDGVLYSVRTGNYMGQNFGVVTAVNESEVVLKELVQDSAGDWVEQESKLLLQGQEVKK